MSLIEGVGDEVTHFVMFVVFCLVIILAWWSTGYRQDRFRTVVIMERNVRRLYRLVPQRMIGRTPVQNVTSWNRNLANQNDSAASDVSSSSIPDTAEIPNTDIPPAATATSPTAPSPTAPRADEPSVEETTAESSPQDVEMDRIVNAMDSDACVLRNRRLAFFNNQIENSATATTTSVDNSSRRSDLSTNESTEKSPDLETNTEEVVSGSEDLPDEGGDDIIRIRLKYLNDDQKLVDGKLHELLGEFKRRHFKGELNTRMLVRLIFNGQVLQGEGATLASCGLFDNCVVHCLVHQPRTPNQYAQLQQQLHPSLPPDSGQSPSISAQITGHILHAEGGQHEDRDWDLSHILLTILASILSVAWYCHIRFSSLFGVAASIAMLGLTALYFIAVICVYYPETQQTPATSAAGPATSRTNATATAE